MPIPRQSPCQLTPGVSASSTSALNSPASPLPGRAVLVVTTYESAIPPLVTNCFVPLTT